MEKITIEFYGIIAKITGEKNIKIRALTINDALNKLSVKYGKLFKDKLYNENGNPRKFINIYVNGKDIRFLNNFTTQLIDGDKISILPAVGGG